MSRSSCSDSTDHVIQELCRECDHCNHFNRNNCVDIFSSETSSFTAIVSPLTNVIPLFSGCTGSVEFRMRRKNKTVTLQWEPFTGNLGANGVSHLSVLQSICNTPPYSVSNPMYIEYKGLGRVTHVEIDPFGKNGNIRFFLNTDGSSNGTVIGDLIKIPGGSTSWIVC